MITLQSLLVRKETGFLVSELGNEMVMMNTRTGDYIGLNEVSTDIWKLLEQPVKTEDIVADLTRRYNVDQHNCESQTIECLNKMLSQGLIQLS